MFHRAKAEVGKPTEKKSMNKLAENPQIKEIKSPAMEQNAVKRYKVSSTGFGDEGSSAINTANGNDTAPYVVEQNKYNLNSNRETQNIKEVNVMNNPQTNQDSSSKENQSSGSNAQQSNPTQNQSQGQPMARVDIPGNNFQRPGATNMNTNRPAYPGTATYPGANAQQAAQQQNYTPTQAADDNSRRLTIGQGISMSGEIDSCDHLLVEGKLEATLKGASVLDVAQSGEFYGTVEIEEANISGRFEGDITVNGRLTIESTGVIIGSVTYKELSMEAGATLDGSVSPIGSPNAGQNRNSGKKAAAPTKAKKVAQNNGAELPFSDKGAMAAE